MNIVYLVWDLTPENARIRQRERVGLCGRDKNEKPPPRLVGVLKGMKALAQRLTLPNLSAVGLIRLYHILARILMP